MNRNNFINYLQQEYVCDVDYPWRDILTIWLSAVGITKNGLLEFLISKAIK